VVTVTVPLTSTKDISQVYIRIFQVGSQTLSGVLIDDAFAILAGITKETPTNTPTPTTPTTPTSPTTPPVSSAPITFTTPTTPPV
jgi:hypothetical protein